MTCGWTTWLPGLVFLLLIATDLSEETLARGLGSDDEVNLIKYLFDDKNYNPLIRPVKNINESIEVQFNLALSQLISVDEKNQIMKTNVWLQMYWYDYQLTWNPEKYGGIKTIRINHSKAWRPDIVLFNNADGKYEVTYESNVVLMQPDGAANIYQVPPAIYKSSCDINVEYFPFDEQECEMKFGSWTFEEDQLNFTYYKFYGLDMTDYLKSGTWDIVDCPARIVICTDPETKRRISMYIAKFIIRRKTLFYTVNLIIPCMLISFVSICVFMLPADAGEKITLIISILLALVVFLLLISKLLPPSKTIPLIAKYLLFTFIMNIIAIGSTVFIINRNYRTPRTHRMPEWVRIVFLKYLPKFLFMTRPNHDNRWKSPLRVYSEENLDEDMKRHVEMCNKHTRNCQLHNISETTEVGYAPLSAELMEATEAIGFITEHLKWEDRYDSVTDDWKYMASVVDRMLLYIFLLVTVCGTIGILVQAPYILENIDQDELLSKIMDKYKLNKEGHVAPATIYQNAPC